MSGWLQRYVPFAKVDDEQHMVYGIATDETPDLDGDVVDYAATKAAVAEWQKWRNVREMHAPSAVGIAEEITLDDVEKALTVGVKVVDEAAWAKVKAGVYKGFSIGGRITGTIRERVGDQRVRRITDYMLTEISLVDRPANPNAAFRLVKRENSLGEQELQVRQAFYAMQQARAEKEGGELWLQEVFAEFCIVESDGGLRLWQYPYTRTEDGIVFGSPVEVEIQYVPVVAPETAAPEAETPETEMPELAAAGEAGMDKQVHITPEELLAKIGGAPDLTQRLAKIDGDVDQVFGDVLKLVYQVEALAKRVADLEAQPAAPAPVIREVGAPFEKRETDDLAALERLIETTTQPLVKEALGKQRALLLLRQGMQP